MDEVNPKGRVWPRNPVSGDGYESQFLALPGEFRPKVAGPAAEWVLSLILPSSRDMRVELLFPTR